MWFPSTVVALVALLVIPVTGTAVEVIPVKAVENSAQIAPKVFIFSMVQSRIIVLFIANRLFRSLTAREMPGSIFPSSISWTIISLYQASHLCFLMHTVQRMVRSASSLRGKQKSMRPQLYRPLFTRQSSTSKTPISSSLASLEVVQNTPLPVP